MTESFILHRAILAQSETCFHREYNLAMKKKSPADCIRAQQNALKRRASRGKNAEAFLNISFLTGSFVTQRGASHILVFLSIKIFEKRWRIFGTGIKKTDFNAG